MFDLDAALADFVDVKKSLLADLFQWAKGARRVLAVAERAMDSLADLSSNPLRE